MHNLEIAIIKSYILNGINFDNNTKTISILSIL